MSTYFKKASKSLAKAKLAITGPAGAGKTLSSLLMAKGLGGVCGVIDTENASASLYSDRFDDWEYFTLPMSPPYTAQKYIRAIDVAIAEGIEVLIIDSLSHVWNGEGGLLQQKDALDSRGGNSFTNWQQITKVFEQLKAKLLHSPIHVIATMRSKQAYVIEQGANGKQAPRKVGLAPEMRDGIEYEFTAVFDLGADHQFMVSKDRTGLFSGVVATITEETGATIRDWLKSDLPPPAPPVPPSPESDETHQAFPPDEPQVHPPIEDQSQEPKRGGGRSQKQKEKPKQTAPKPRPAKESDQDLFEYVIPVGQFVGRKVKDLTESQVKGVLQWTESALKKPHGDKQTLGKVFSCNATLKQFFKSIGQWPVNFAPGVES